MVPRQGLEARHVIAWAEGPGTSLHNFYPPCKGEINRAKDGQRCWRGIVTDLWHPYRASDICVGQHPALQAGLSHDGLSALKRIVRPITLCPPLLSQMPRHSVALAGDRTCNPKSVAGAPGYSWREPMRHKPRDRRGRPDVPAHLRLRAFLC